MSFARPHGSTRLTCVAIVLVSLALPALGGQGADHIIVFQTTDADASTTGVWTFQGILKHEATLAQFECAELVEGRNGTFSWFGRAASLTDATRWYVKIVDFREGVGTAMGGVARSASSSDHCGAAAIGAYSPMLVVAKPSPY